MHILTNIRKVQHTTYEPHTICGAYTMQAYMCHIYTKCTRDKHERYQKSLILQIISELDMRSMSNWLIVAATTALAAGFAL